MLLMLRNAIFNNSPPPIFLTNVIFNGFVVVQTLWAILIDLAGKVSFWATPQPKFNLATIKLRLIKLVGLGKLILLG